jgi:hypothetical protein
MKNCILAILTLVLCMFACKKKDRATPFPRSSVTLSKFVLTKVDNPSLKEDIEAEIVGTTINLLLHGVNESQLRATVISDAVRSDYDGRPLDLTKEAKINLTDKNGIVVRYTVKAVFRDLYFTNQERQLSRNLAVYWKNGEKVRLTDSANLSLSEHSLAIDVKGNDVYTAGTSTNNQLQRTVAVYWRNGVKTELTNGDGHASAIGWAKAIKVVGNDVYVMGGVFYPGLSKYGVNVQLPVYWKNGVFTPLTDGKSMADVTGMLIHNNDCYITGYIKGFVNDNASAAYWKNGNVIKLTDGTRIAVAKAIAIINNDVHVVGVDDAKIAHWKNGTKSELGKGMAFDIYGKGTDLFIGAHSEQNEGTVWKNGQLVHKVNARAFNLTVVDSDRYLIGTNVAAGSQQFFFYLNHSQKPFMIGEIDHVEAEDIPHAFLIKSR